ncbi:F0F1 ATP synthase subunit epsilon [Solimonas flava]|uniref:F0F1 ATP synthase subunit epsilon n=1 Tax=Solimonas flava TaxID=415849 RepID=UPI00040FBCA7|nr:F0F1 ATP synthase subunit epsilon [Solimonas flava]
MSHAPLRLSVSSLGALLVDAQPIVALRAEDASGAFGILPGHADFLTVLDVGVLGWREADGRQRYCAVRGGVLTVRGGVQLDVATREAIVDDDLERLESTVLRQFHEHDDADRRARTETVRMELRAVRELLRYLEPAEAGAP